MDRARLPFADSEHPDRYGALALDDSGRVALRAGPDLVKALETAVEDPKTDLAPLAFDHGPRGLALAAALAKGMAARLVECELVAGAFELRAYVNGWVHLTLRPGDFDPDRAWDFVLAVNEAKLEAARP